MAGRAPHHKFKKGGFHPVRHPGRLTNAAKKNGLSLKEQARKWVHSGNTSEQRAGNLYLKVFSKRGKWKHLKGRPARAAARKGARTRARRGER